MNQETFEAMNEEVFDFLSTHPERLDQDIEVLCQVYNRYACAAATASREAILALKAYKDALRDARVTLQSSKNPVTGKPYSRDVAEDMAEQYPEVSDAYSRYSDLQYQADILKVHVESIQLKGKLIPGMQGRENRGPAGA